MLDYLYIFCICLAALTFRISLAQTSYGDCTTPDNKAGTCVELQQCKPLYDLVQINLSDKDRTFLAKSQCGYLNSKVLVCCGNTPKPSGNADMRFATNKKLLPTPPECGSVLADRIYGGVETKLDEYPWMALIEYTKPRNEKGHHCGGALINNRYVITAAHCVTGSIPADWTLSGVRLGEWNTATNPDCEYDIRNIEHCAPEHLDVPVNQIIPHPQYGANTRTKLNDIALLRLARSVTYNDYVRPICLPIESSLRNANFVDIRMDVAGWGRTKTESVSEIKQKATVKVWDLSKCQQKYTSQRINIEDSQLCAGGESGIDSCRGDSGGPLISEHIVNRLPTYYLTGIVSYGPTPCGLQGWPGVYTRVGSHMEWIQSTIRA